MFPLSFRHTKPLHLAKCFVQKRLSPGLAVSLFWGRPVLPVASCCSSWAKSPSSSCLRSRLRSTSASTIRSRVARCSASSHCVRSHWASIIGARLGGSGPRPHRPEGTGDRSARTRSPRPRRAHRPSPRQSLSPTPDRLRDRSNSSCPSP